MIDYIKLNIPDRVRLFEAYKEEYNFDRFRYERFDKVHNELKTYETIKKNFGNLELKVTNKNFYIHNSIHKFHNQFFSRIDGNYDDFSYSKMAKTVNKLSELLHVSPSDLTIGQGLEFGLNLKVDFDINDFLQRECVLFNFKEAVRQPVEFPYKEFQQGNRVLKLYDKGIQQNPLENILRIELKYKEDKRDFNRHGIETLEDLLNKDNLHKMYGELEDLVNKKLMIVNRVDEINPSQYLSKRIYSFCSAKYWNENSHKNLINANRCFKRHKLLNRKNGLLNLMNSKFQELIEN